MPLTWTSPLPLHTQFQAIRKLIACWAQTHLSPDVQIWVQLSQILIVITLQRANCKGPAIPAGRAGINEEVYGELAGIPWHREKLEGVLLQIHCIPDGGSLRELLGRRVWWHCQRRRRMLMRVLTTLDGTFSLWTPDLGVITCRRSKCTCAWNILCTNVQHC